MIYDEKFLSELFLAVKSRRCLSETEKRQIRIYQYSELAECFLFGVALLEYFGEVKKGSVKTYRQLIEQEMLIAQYKAPFNPSVVEEFKRKFVG